MGQLVVSAVTWAPVSGPTGTNIRFHVRWENPDDDAPSGPIAGHISSQEFGVFLPDYGQIGSFNVPPLQPASFFDVFLEVPLDQLPPAPQKVLPGGGGAGFSAASAKNPRTNLDCPPDTNWAGNVDIQWGGPGQGGQVNKHYGDLLTCAGGAPSYIHFRPSNCTAPMFWTIAGVCPGYTVTLVNEDFSPAPQPVPVGWSGWIGVTAAASVPSGTSCCFAVTFTCLNASSTIDNCSTACDCDVHPPTLSTVDWTTTGSVVTFHQHWTNESATHPSDPVSGEMSSQEFGVFLPNYGPIGHFDVPPIAPSGFFDVFFDVDLADLPPNPTITVPGGNPPAGTPCYTEDHWHGNVDISWTGAGGGSVNKHFGEMPVCPGSAPTTLFVETMCNAPTGAAWNITGLCPGWTATLVNTDLSLAPNPVPPGWIGLISVQAAAGVPIGSTCCFQVNFSCGGELGTIDVCAKACACANPQPTLTGTDWTLVGENVRFHMRWENPATTGDSDPVSGTMSSQPFGAFVPNFGPIGQFNVPPMAPSSFFDVFIEVPLSSLPPQPQKILPGGGPQARTPKGDQTESTCPPDTSWSGNVDIQWGGPGGGGQTNNHFSGLLVNPGIGSSHLHALIFCNDPAGATFSITGVCPGWHVALLNEDFTPASSPVPPGWTGWISVAADANVPPGSSCCFSITFICDGQPGVIDVCAEACAWDVGGTDVVPNPENLEFGILRTAPNPSSGDMSIAFIVPKSDRVFVGIYDLAGRRVRTLWSGAAEAGVRSLHWDGRGDDGQRLSSGAYFVKLENGSQRATRKLLLSR
jgi:hypothetical protein